MPAWATAEARASGSALGASTGAGRGGRGVELRSRVREREVRGRGGACGGQRDFCPPRGSGSWPALAACQGWISPSSWFYAAWRRYEPRGPPAAFSLLPWTCLLGKSNEYSPPGWIRTAWSRWYCASGRWGGVRLRRICTSRRSRISWPFLR